MHIDMTLQKTMIDMTPHTPVYKETKRTKRVQSTTKKKRKNPWFVKANEHTRATLRISQLVLSMWGIFRMGLYEKFRDRINPKRSKTKIIKTSITFFCYLLLPTKMLT